MIVIKTISTSDPHYSAMRELRNRILLRPLGLADNSWEMYDKESWLFVAIDDNVVVGCAILVPSEGDRKSAQLMQMAVDANLQGKGIGKLLVTELVALAKENGFSEIRCHSRKNAINFYKSFGFEVYGEPFEEVGIPHSHMKLTLNRD